jgi:iduronate 2-sulfatase
MRKPTNGVTRTSLISVWLMAVVVSVACDSAEEAARPNILFIAVDDLRPELGCYGADHVVSPNIDRLASEGLVFNRAYCQSAVCNPSRASLMAGKRPDTLRVWDLKSDMRTLNPDVVTLGQHLKAHGYHSVGIGKIFHNTLPDDVTWSEPKMHIDGYPFDPDAVYRGEEGIRGQEEKKAEIIEAGNEAKAIDQFGQWYLKAQATENVDVPDSAYFDGAQTDVAVDKLAELKELDRPFFFAVGYYRPHLPFNAPKKYWDLYDRDQIPMPENPDLPEGIPEMAINNLRELRGYTDFRDLEHPTKGTLDEERTRLLRHGYFASVSYVDAQVGKLLQALEDLGLDDDTIVILWGDHGWKLGEHNSWCKMTNLEIDARVPLILKVPGMANRGAATDALVEFVDVYPTLCDLTGIPVPQDLEGTSFKPLVGNPSRPWKKAAFTQFLREGIWIAPDGVEYMGYSVRTDSFRYTEWVNWETNELAATELYDHESDPMENRNVAGDSNYEDTRAEMAAVLEAGWQAARPR